MTKFSIRSRFKSFQYAVKGMMHVFKLEHNMWIHLCAAVCVIIAGFYFHISTTEWIVITFAIGMVISAELFNTAIEKLVDLTSPQYNETAGLIKDIAAGAVLVCAVVAVITGFIVFVPKLF